MTVGAKRQDVPRAIKTLSDLMVTAMGYTAYYQRKITEFQQAPDNVGKLPDPDLHARFMDGLLAAGRFAKELAPFQDPKFANVKVEHTPLMPLDEPKLIEGKDLKINLNDPIEVARVYRSLVRAA
jgi:hypothetical protein